MNTPKLSSLLPAVVAAIALCSCRSGPPVKRAVIVNENREEPATPIRATYEYSAAPSVIAAGARRYFGEAARDVLAERGQTPSRVVIQDATLRKTPSSKLCRVDLTGYVEPGGGWDGTVTDLSPLAALAREAERE